MVRFLLLLFLCFSPNLVNGVEKPEEVLPEVGVKPILGQTIDLTLPFTDEDGKTAPLGELIDPKKPIVITPVYYGCPRLCGFLLSGAVTLFNALDLGLGEEYQVVTVSFDETEGAELAKERGREYREKLSRAGSDKSSWRFFVGKKESITPLMKSLGFSYKKDGEEFAHSAAIIILTPLGKISQYFTGIEFSPWDVRLSLIDASQGSIGSAIDHVLLYCFRFDPTKGKYTLAAFNVMKAGGVLSLLALGSVVFFVARKS